MRHQFGHLARTKPRRTTLALPDNLLVAVDRLVRSGFAASRSEFIAAAVDLELHRRERAAIDAEFESMASDPAYRAESADLMREFEGADRETWENLSKAEQ
jgi:Arc/MetJ-type ribon-helix-helix transcriptional regulator